jgi:hypothetical protein
LEALVSSPRASEAIIEVLSRRTTIIHRPTSESGKAKSSLNAVKTGLTSRTILLPSDDAALYDTDVAEFMKRLAPANEDEAVRKHLIEAKIFPAYQRQLKNLSIQEGRLRRQREKDTTAVRELQDNRKRQAKARLDKAARQYIQAVYEKRHEEFDPAALGFEFSLAEIELRAMDIDPNLFADYERQMAEAA